jgi:periplasmic divalent cation tolerance protein
MIVALTTVPRDAAEGLASRLVEERLAACVNVHPTMTSTYRWKGSIEREEECQLVMKTSRARAGDLERRLHELHPYELPEFIVVQVAASEGYADWVDAETRR